MGRIYQSDNGDMRLVTARASDWPSVSALLTQAGLPLEGARAHLDNFVLAVDDAGAIRGSAGYELYGDCALLRSVAVAEEYRGAGLGGALVNEAIGRLSGDGVKAVVLLTTTAEKYFERHGFRRIERSAAPEPVTASVEFRSACPSSAAVMMLTL